MIRAVRIASTIAALFLVAIVARADTRPNRWDLARDPSLEASWRLHAYVRALLDEREPSGRDDLARRARILLEDAGAAASPDVLLRFDLGAACARLRDERCVILVLEPAIAMAPNHPAATEAFDALAHSYAVLDDSVNENRICERYLPRVTEDHARAILLLNCAEAEMHLGALDRAVDEYRAAIDVAAAIPNVIALEDQTETLAVWGLSVALDRARDAHAAEKEAHLALSLDPGMQLIARGPNVFFSPERERYWYLGLGFSDYAREAPTADASASLWSRAEGCWREYVADVVQRGKEKDDRWVDLARIRLTSARAARILAEKRAKKRADVEPRCMD